MTAGTSKGSVHASAALNVDAGVAPLAPFHDDVTVAHGRRPIVYDVTAPPPPRGRPPSSSPPLQPLSGIYCGGDQHYRIELLVELDLIEGRPRLTADFFALEGVRQRHVGWCFVRSASLEFNLRRTVIKGFGRFSFRAAAPLLQITIAHSTVREPHAPAELQFLNTTLAPGAVYRCDHCEHWPVIGDAQCTPPSPRLLLTADCAHPCPR